MKREHDVGPEPDPARFPTVWWDDLEVTFRPSRLPEDLHPSFVVVFARCGEGFVLADIPGRGWITPSGRIEPGETPIQAAIRETREEIGAELEVPLEIGYYLLRPTEGEPTVASAFVGRVKEFGQVPAGSESRGARQAMAEELPGLYWRWDPLLEAMFQYAEGYSTSRQFRAHKPSFHPK